MAEKLMAKKPMFALNLALCGLLPAIAFSQSVTSLSDLSYKWVIPPSFASASPFNEGRALVAITASSDAEKKYGYIDRTGRFVIAPEFDDASTFYEGLASAGYCQSVTVNGERQNRCTYGYINNSGSFVINPQFDGAGDFINGWAAVQNRTRDDMEWQPPYYINRAGEKKRTLPYNGNITPKIPGLEPGYTTPVFRYDTSDPRPNTEGLLAFRDREGMYGYIDYEGNVVISPQFSFAAKFSEGLAAVGMKNAGYGYINKQGTLVIKPRFLTGRSFNGGLAAVLVAVSAKEGRFAVGLIDRAGDYVVPPQEDWESADTCCEGLILVKRKDGKYGYVAVTRHAK